MSNFFITPASIAYLTQFILGLAITLFLLNRLRSQRTISLILLTGFFAPLTVFIGLLIFNASFLPFPRLLTVYAENATLGLALVAMNAFAYHFPERYPQHKWEMRIALTVSLAYFLWEVGFMIFRYISLLSQGNVFIRPAIVAYSIPVVILFAPFAFLRQTLAADPRPVAWWHKLWKPEGKGAQGARSFALVFCIPVVLGIINALVFFGLSLMLIHAAMSIGVLIMLWLLANNYVHFIPGSVNVASRLSILTLTLFLAMLGSLSWMIAPAYFQTFHSTLRDHQTFRFTPNDSGGYDVDEVDFNFESAFGEKVGSQTLDEYGNYRVAFTFPFYGKTYTEAYINHAGIISMGETFRTLNLQAAGTRIPTLFPLVISLNPDPAEADSGLYVRQNPERLVITWNRLLTYSQPAMHYTFQSILYADGTFEFTYNELPQVIPFNPNAGPSDNPLLRGVVAGRNEPFYELPDGMKEPADLVSISGVGATPLLENYLLAFRRYLHTFMLPVAWVVIGGSLLILLVIPVLLRSSISKPLEALTNEVRRMGTGEMGITIPVRSQDEIGFLTGAFNTMSAALDDQVRNLETRVADRTRELGDANASLRAEMVQRESVQNQLLQQQRTLAALEEREQMGRDLHDGLGQVLGAINVESQVLQSFLDDGRTYEVRDGLERLAGMARLAHGDLRRFILGLRTPLPTDNFFATLSFYTEQFSRECGIPVSLSMPAQESLPVFAPVVEAQVLHIIQEALTNVRKHASASAVDVLFSILPGQVQIIISDDGVGFDPKTIDEKTHFGLAVMRERAARMGGGLEVRSAPGKNTRILLSVPRLPASAQPATAQDSDVLRGARILIVDDSPLFLEGLRSLLISRGLTVSGLAHDGQEALEMARLLRPDIILMDIRMPRCDGLEAVRRVKAELPETKVIMLTVSEDEKHLFETIRSGASGYLLKSLEANALVEMLANVMRGEAAFSPGLAARLLQELGRPQAGISQTRFPDMGLSETHRRVLDLVADGKQYKEVAAELGISVPTVKYHMGKILEILHLKNRAQVVEYVKNLRK